MTDPHRDTIMAVLPARAMFGKTTAQVASETGIDSQIVRTQLRAMERGGDAKSIRGAKHRKLYGREQ